MPCFNPEDYQVRAIDYLTSTPEAALYMGCGMGKTISSLVAASELFSEGAIRGVLIIAPKRVANITWAAEVAKFEETSWMTVANLRTKEGMDMLSRGEAHIYTINYESLPKVCPIIRKMFSRKKLPFNLTIFDELTLTKNPSSERLKSYRNLLREKVDYHWGLTGTPLVNNLLDLFGQIRVLDGGKHMGKNFGTWQKEHFYTSDFAGRKWELFPHLKGVIEASIEDMCLSLRREDYLDLPDIIVEDVNVPMERDTRKMYNVLKKHRYTPHGDLHITADSAGVLVQKLLQLTGGGIFSDVDEEGEKEVIEMDTAKVKALEKLVKKLKEPVLVGANFTHEQERIRRHFPEAQFTRDCKNDAEEADLISRWNAGKVPILVGHPKSIGHGLNMQDGGRYVIWYTLPWSRELYDQFNCRLSRRGQGEEVTVFRLMSKGTIDDDVAEALRNKLGTRETFLTILESLENN